MVVPKESPKEASATVSSSESAPYRAQPEIHSWVQGEKIIIGKKDQSRYLYVKLQLLLFSLDYVSLAFHYFFFFFADLCGWCMYYFSGRVYLDFEKTLLYIQKDI